MTRKYSLLCALAAALLVLPIGSISRAPFGSSAAEAREQVVSVSYFYDALADEGDWIRYQPYGYVWVPTDVRADWQPYTHGRWANTEEYGWTFVSDEPFAWAVYHYGRWGYDEDIGWFWVPGTVWAPAWVAWRRSSDVIGWAPLPPEGRGYAVSAEVEYYEPPREYWHYCETREFLAPDLAVVIIYDDEPYYDETEDLGPVVVQNNIVVNNIITVRSIEQVVRQPVPVTRVEIVRDPREAEQVRDGDRVVAFQGKLAAPAKKAAPPRVVDATAVKAPTKGQKILRAAGQGGDRQAKTKGRVENQAETVSPQPRPAIEPGPKKLKRPGKLQGNVVQQQDEPPPPKSVKTKKGAQARVPAGAEADQPRRKVKSAKPIAPKVATEVAPVKVKPGKPPRAKSGVTSPAGMSAAAAPSTKQAQKKLKMPGAANQGVQRQAASAPPAKPAPKKLKKPAPVRQEVQRQAAAPKVAKPNKRIAATAPAPKRPSIAASGPRKPKKLGLPPSQEKTAAIPRPKAAKPAPARPAKQAVAPKGDGRPKACSPKLHAAGKC